MKWKVHQLEHPIVRSKWQLSDSTDWMLPDKHIRQALLVASRCRGSSRLAQSQGLGTSAAQIDEPTVPGWLHSIGMPVLNT